MHSLSQSNVVLVFVHIDAVTLQCAGDCLRVCQSVLVLLEAVERVPDEVLGDPLPAVAALLLVAGHRGRGRHGLLAFIANVYRASGGFTINYNQYGRKYIYRCTDISIGAAI